MPAVGAAQTKKAVGQIAALEEGVELVFDELRQAGAADLFGRGEEGLGVLLYQPDEIGAVAGSGPGRRRYRPWNWHAPW